MSFLSWAALAVAALVAAPLLAHLLRRRPPDEVPFAATKLVPATPAVAQRRTALEDRALLAIRVLAVLALAVLGATPFARCSRLSLAREGGASVALAIVLDDSMSMRVALEPGGDTTRLERAREAALELLDGLTPGDVVAVVLAGDPVRVALAASTNLDAARSIIGQAPQTDRGTDLDGAVSIAGELLGDLEHVDKRVVVLSDLAGGDRALAAPTGAKLWVPLDPLRGARHNCGVVHADRNQRRVAMRVACFGAPDASAAGQAGDAAAVSLAIKAGDEVLAELPLRLDDSADDVVLKIPEDAVLDDHVRLRAVLSGARDAIAADDSAPVVSVGGQLRVGAVSDPASSQVATGGPPAVEQAYNALGLGVQLRPLSTTPDRSEDLAELGVLIADDVPGFTPSQRRELSDWVDAGGVLLITLGPGAAAAPLGSSFAPLLPAIVRWSVDAPPGIDMGLSGGLFGESLEGMDALHAAGRAIVDMERDGAPEVIAKWSDGVPFAFERRMGRGVIYALTLPFDTERSDLALRPAFLHMLERLAVTARTLGGVARTDVGAVWVLEGFDQVAVSRLDERDAAQPIEVAKAGRERRAVPQLAGLYELDLDGGKTMRVAAVSEDEIDLRPRPVAEAHDDASLGGVSGSVDVSSYVALALLGLLFAELLLRLGSPRVRPTREDSPASSRPAA